MKYACVFPGQGSQAVGMGKELAAAEDIARRTFAEADEALGFSISDLCWQGPEDQLVLTQYTQPAILTDSIASWRVLSSRTETLPALVAGHSLGEYSALVAAGVLRFEDAVRLVHERGRLMQEAVPVGEGAMAAVLGPDAADVEAVAARAADDTGEVCAVANYNAPGQTVIAGSKRAVEMAVELAKEAGAKRSILLPVSAPFHCALMVKAREGMQPLLEDTEFGDPRVPVVCNVDAKVVRTGDEAREALVRQIDGAVRWVDSVQAMIGEGVEAFFEVGPGAVLSGLGRRIDRSVPTSASGSLEQIEKTVASIQGSA